MDVRSALSELGLTSLPPRTELRRAYLRQVRLHSPERDPEGFERVRAAFELLRNAEGEVWSLPAPEEHRDIPLQYQEHKVSLERDHSETVALSFKSEVTFNLKAELGVPSEPETLGESMERVFVLLERPEVDWDQLDWLVAGIRERSGHGALGERVKSLAEGGSSRALRLLLCHFAERVDERAILRARESSEPRILLALGEVLSERGDTIRLAGLMIQMLSVPGFEQALLPNPGWTVDTILECYAKGDMETAAALLDAFEGRNRQSVQPGRVPDRVAVRWAVARELRELAEFSSPALRKELAQAAQSGNTESLERALKREHRKYSELDVEIFNRRAPGLFRLVEAFLPRATKVEPAPRQRAWVPYVIAAFVLSSAGRLLLGAHNHGSTTTPAWSDTTAWITLPPRSQPGAGVAMDPAGLVRAAQKLDYLSLSDRTSTLWKLVNAGDCSGAEAYVPAFAEAAGPALRASSSLQAPMDGFLSELSVRCGITIVLSKDEQP